MIEVTNATKIYGVGGNATTALKGVSLTINDECFMVLIYN